MISPAERMAEAFLANHENLLKLRETYEAWPVAGEQTKAYYWAQLLRAVQATPQWTEALHAAKAVMKEKRNES